MTSTASTVHPDGSRTFDALGVTWRARFSASVDDKHLLSDGFPDSATLNAPTFPVGPWAVTDVYLSPVDPDRPDDHGRNVPVTVNGVSYVGWVRHTARTYLVHAADSPTRSAWYFRDHYTDASNMTRGWETAFTPPTDAARRTFTDALSPFAESMLTDGAAVSAYWSRHFADLRRSRMDAATRELIEGNRYGDMARPFGADFPSAVVAELDDAAALPPVTWRYLLDCLTVDDGENAPAAVDVDAVAAYLSARIAAGAR